MKPRNYSTERYSRLMKWTRHRYTYTNTAGERCLDTYHGYKPTHHTIIEAMAANAYLHIGRTPRQVLADGIGQAFSGANGYRHARAWRKEQ